MVLLGGAVLFAGVARLGGGASRSAGSWRLTSSAATRRPRRSLPRQLNILHVVLEDFGVLGSSLFGAPGGAPNGTTPHLAALARRSLTFQRAYCNVPICNPSRSSLLVGRRPSHTRMYTNADSFEASVPPSTPTLVGFLRAADPAASVACAGGKIFHQACDVHPRGLSLPDASPGRGVLRSSADDGRSNDEHKTDAAIALLRQYASNRSRFYLGVGLSATHVMRPAGLCSERAARAAGYTGTSASVAGVALPPPRQSERRPPLLSWPNYDLKADGRMAGRKQRLTALEARRAVHSYVACASHVDEQLGRLVRALAARARACASRRRMRTARASRRPMHACTGCAARAAGAGARLAAAGRLDGGGGAQRPRVLPRPPRPLVQVRTRRRRLVHVHGVHRVHGVHGAWCMVR